MARRDDEAANAAATPDAPASPRLPDPSLRLDVGPRAPNILVFDSGIGGLTVAREIRAARPDAAMTYVADDAGFPYGDWEEGALTAHIVGLAARLIADFSPDVFVVACNTAATLVLPHLRNRFPVSFVGTVPAIKPAASTTRSRLISVLATPGTVKRDYTRALIDTYASHLEVTLVGSTRLARIAEDHLAGRPVDDAEIAREIKPCFRRHLGRRTDRVVLACTHYPFLVDHFRLLAPWPVEWIDPAPAIARRVVQLIGAAPTGAAQAPGRVVFTSGATPSPALTRVLAGMGLATTDTARPAFAP